MSIAEVAKTAGVSQATVSYVINKKPGVSEQTIAKVNQVIKDLGYVPRPSRTRGDSPAGTAHLKSRNIALVMPEDCMSQSQLNSQLFEAIHEQLDKNSLRLIPVRLSKGASLEATIAGNKTLANLDGIILFYYDQNNPLGSSQNVPIVSVLGHPSPMAPLLCDHIEPDNVRIGAIAAKYLADKEHSNIAVINPSTSLHSAIEIRCQAFLDAGTALNVKAVTHRIPLKLSAAETLAYITEDHPLSKWIQNYKDMPNKPTGIFVPSDSHLAIVFHAFKRAGIEPGTDVEFIGCNNESMLLHSLSPTPATIDLQPQQIAKTSINVLLQRIRTNYTTHTSTYIEPTLITF